MKITKQQAHTLNTKPLMALHAMGIFLSDLAPYVKYNGQPVSVEELKQWIHEPLQNNKKKFKILTNALIKVLLKEGRLHGNVRKRFSKSK